MRKGFLILLVLMSILIGCKSAVSDTSVEILLSGISDKEFYELSEASKPEGISRSDIKKLQITAEINITDNASDRSITIPDLSMLINRGSELRAITGGATESNNKGSKAEASAYIVFDSRNLNDDEIRELFNEASILITFKSRSNETQNIKVNIGEDIVFTDK